MIYTLLFLILFGQATTPNEAWDALPQFSDTEIKEITPSTTFEKKIPLTLIRLKNSKWTEEEVLAKVRRTEAIYSQCGWSFSPITLVSTTHVMGSAVSEEALFYNKDFSYVDLEPLGSQVQRPVVFLVDTNNAILGDGGFSVRAGQISEAKGNAKMLNMTVLYREWALDEKRSSSELDKDGYYEVLAHELGHVVFDQSHIEDRQNLMSGLNHWRNNRINQDQCAKDLTQFEL